jgi:hypothetical protein
MPKRPRHYLFTSVSPRLRPEELDYQRSCIASWRTAGFDVATVNGHAEVERIRSLELDAEIVPVREAGKPVISDILACAKERNCQYAGIINADCTLLPYPELARRMTEELHGAIAIVERLDVDDHLMPQPDSCSGFDAFFFDMAVIPTGFDRNFKMGVPWWDYCFPMAAAARGARIVNIGTPLLTHRMHHHSWSEEERESVGRLFWSFLRNWRATGRENFPSLGSDLDDLWSEDTLTTTQLAVVGLACFRWLQRQRSERAQRFLPADLQPIEALFHAQRIALNELNQNAALLDLELKSRKAEAMLEYQLAEARKRIDAVEQSRSWRLTKPLRDIGEIASASFRRLGSAEK